VFAFVLRNSSNFLNLFLPVQIASLPVSLGLGLLLIAAAVVAVIRLRPFINSGAMEALWTFLVSGITLAAIILAGVAGKYPFGGVLRQQFLLFPFLVLCLAIVGEQLARAVGSTSSPRTRLAANAGLAVLAAGAGIAQYTEYPKVSYNILEPQMAAFDRLERSPAAVYLDQFNLITFFVYHHDWKWTLQREQPIKGIDVYRLRKGGMEMLVFRDKTRWNLDPDEAPAYKQFAELLKVEGTPALSVFDVRQEQSKSPFSDIKGVQSQILTLASSSAVCVQKMLVGQTYWYVTFRPSGCQPIAAGHERGASGGAPGIKASQPADDTDDAIDYVGAWSHGNFEGARGGTLSYSRDAGAVARATFQGSEITYIYTKAFNRGIAEIRIDGISKGNIDLFSPNIVWQARNAFGGLRRGKHTVEVLVTGNKNLKAADSYVDVDALIVH
jgi:hypothetical protein